MFRFALGSGKVNASDVVPVNGNAGTPAKSAGGVNVTNVVAVSAACAGETTANTNKAANAAFKLLLFMISPL